MYYYCERATDIRSVIALSPFPRGKLCSLAHSTALLWVLERVQDITSPSDTGTSPLWNIMKSLTVPVRLQPVIPFSGNTSAGSDERESRSGRLHTPGRPTAHTHIGTYGILCCAKRYSKGYSIPERVAFS